MILYIDDEPSYTREYIEELEDEDFDVTLITKTDDLSNWLSNDRNISKIKLVILDMMMPAGTRYMDKPTDLGTKTGEFILKDLDKIIPNVPKIILSNKYEDHHGVQLAQEYLCKEQVTPEGLMNVVRKYL